MPATDTGTAAGGGVLALFAIVLHCIAPEGTKGFAVIVAHVVPGVLALEEPVVSFVFVLLKGDPIGASVAVTVCRGR